MTCTTFIKKESKTNIKPLVSKKVNSIITDDLSKDKSFKQYLIISISRFNWQKFVKIFVIKHKYPSVNEFSGDNGEFSGERDDNEKYFWK